MLLPAWLALIEQLPVPVSVTVVPASVQAPLALNVTGRPDEAVALMVKGGSPKRLFGSAPKLIVWLALRMLKGCGSGGAALNVASPAWLAVTVQVPGAVIVTVLLASVQLPLALNVTGRPDEAVALTVKGGLPYCLLPSGPNVIVCSALVMSNTAVSALDSPLDAAVNR